MVIFVEEVEGWGRVLIVDPDELSDDAETFETTDETIPRSTINHSQQRPGRVQVKVG